MELKCSDKISSDLTWHVVLPRLPLSWNNTETKLIIFKQNSHKAIKIILERYSVSASCILAALWGEVASVMEFPLVIVPRRGLGCICSPCSAVGKHSWKLGAAEQTLCLCRMQLQGMRGAEPKSRRGGCRPREPTVWESALLLSQPAHFLLVLSFLKAFCCSHLYWVKYHRQLCYESCHFLSKGFLEVFARLPAAMGNAPHLELVMSPIRAGRWTECYGCCFAASHWCSKREPPAWEQSCCLCWASTHAEHFAESDGLQHVLSALLSWSFLLIYARVD